jgi:uncharacterized protein
VVVGVRVWDLQLPGSFSLKEKRSVVQSLKKRLHNEFNISAAETAHHDVHQRTELAVCVVSTDRKQANAVLQSADGMVAQEHRVRIMDSYSVFY